MLDDAFSGRILDASEFKEPGEKAVGKAEMQMAKQLIESMTSEWKPELYTDEYHKALENMIEEKIEHGGEILPVPAEKKKPTNIVDLVSVLEQSIRQTQVKPKSEKLPPKHERGGERRLHNHLLGKELAHLSLRGGLSRMAETTGLGITWFSLEC